MKINKILFALLLGMVFGGGNVWAAKKAELSREHYDLSEDLLKRITIALNGKSDEEKKNIINERQYVHLLVGLWIDIHENYVEEKRDKFLAVFSPSSLLDVPNVDGVTPLDLALEKYKANDANKCVFLDIACNLVRSGAYINGENLVFLLKQIETSGCFSDGIKRANELKKKWADNLYYSLVEIKKETDATVIEAYVKKYYPVHQIVENFDYLTTKGGWPITKKILTKTNVTELMAFFGDKKLLEEKRNGETALQLAIRLKNEEAKKCLIAQGAMEEKDALAQSVERLLGGLNVLKTKLIDLAKKMGDVKKAIR